MGAPKEIIHTHWVHNGDNKGLWFRVWGLRIIRNILRLYWGHGKEDGNCLGFGGG